MYAQKGWWTIISHKNLDRPTGNNNFEVAMCYMAGEGKTTTAIFILNTKILFSHKLNHFAKQKHQFFTFH